MIGIRYLYIEKPFTVKGKVNIFQVGENLYVIVPLDSKVVVTKNNENKLFVYDGQKWEEK